MRAVGASTGKVLQVVLIEGVLIAALSWAVALVVSVPATVLVETITGNIFTQAPLATSFSGLGIGLWLAIVVVLATKGIILTIAGGFLIVVILSSGGAILPHILGPIILAASGIRLLASQTG